MAKRNNRTCKCCGEIYTFCPTCTNVKPEEKYLMMFCSKNCRDIFYNCSLYSVGQLDREKAQSILSELDLSKKEQFSEQLQKDISEIMYVEPVYEYQDIVEETPEEMDTSARKSKRNKKVTEEVLPEI